MTRFQVHRQSPSGLMFPMVAYLKTCRLQASKPPIKYPLTLSYPTLARRVTVSSSRLGGSRYYFLIYILVQLPKVQIVHLTLNQE
jgi:hypothetical protein